MVANGEIDLSICTPYYLAGLDLGLGAEAEFNLNLLPTLPGESISNL